MDSVSILSPVGAMSFLDPFESTETKFDQCGHCSDLHKERQVFRRIGTRRHSGREGERGRHPTASPEG